MSFSARVISIDYDQIKKFSRYNGDDDDDHHDKKKCAHKFLLAFFSPFCKIHVQKRNSNGASVRENRDKLRGKMQTILDITLLIDWFL